MTVPGEEQDRELPAEIERELELALRAAWQPSEIDPARHEALLALCLEDPLAEPTDDEVKESERLRQALEGELEHPDALLARALRLSHSPSTQKAIELPELPAELRPSEAPRRGRVIFVAFGAATTLLAAAAALVLVVGSLTRSEQPMAAAPAAPAAPAPASLAAAETSPNEVAVSRSSAGLFHDRFTVEETTARVDRIASVRGRELRQNLYHSWGVR